MVEMVPDFDTSYVVKTVTLTEGPTEVPEISLQVADTEDVVVVLPNGNVAKMVYYIFMLF